MEMELLDSRNPRQAASDTKKSFTDHQIEAMLIEFIDHAESHPKYMHQRERAAICEEFEQGKQWTEAQYARWQEVGIEPITINRCLTTIKSLDGMYLDSLQDITAKPRKGGTDTAAQIITEIFKHAQDMGGFDVSAFNTFNKGNIQAEAHIWLIIDKTKTVNGQLRFESTGFFDVIIDPDCEEYDIDTPLTGAKYAIRKIYGDRDEINIIYDKFESSMTDGRTAMENYIAEATTRTQFYTEEEKTFRSCIYECWWKEAVTAFLVSDSKTGQVKMVKGSDASKYRKLAKKSKSGRYSMEKAVGYILHKSIMINGKLMDDESNPLGEQIDFYPCVRYVSIFRESYNRGVLDDIVSVNYEENLKRTQVARLLNLTTNSGWMVDKVTDAKALEDLKESGSVPGYVVDKSKFGGGVEKIKPNQLSQGHLVLAQQSSTDVNEITGLNAANRGYEKGTSDEPGIVLNLRKEQGEAANSSIFKNFRWSLEILGNKMMAIFDSMDIYTPEEIRLIISESHMIDEKTMQKAHNLLFSRIGATLPQPTPMQAPGPELWNIVSPEQMSQVYDTIKSGIQGAQIYAEQYPQLAEKFQEVIKETAIQMLLEDLFSHEVTQFGIKIALSPQTTTARLRVFTILMSLQDKYGAIPLDILLEYSELPNKDEIIQRIRQAQAMSQMQAQQQVRQQIPASRPNVPATQGAA